MHCHAINVNLKHRIRRVILNETFENLINVIKILGFVIKDHFGQELTGKSFFNTKRHSLNFEVGQCLNFDFCHQ